MADDSPLPRPSRIYDAGARTAIAARASSSRPDAGSAPSLDPTGVTNVQAEILGEDAYATMLVSYLTDRPFHYFDHIRVNTVNLSFKAYTDWTAEDERSLQEGTTVNPAGGFLVTPRHYPGVAEQQPGKYPFLGRIIVLINGRTFSAAADFSAVAHHLKLATFIGEETGGAYDGNNSGEMPLLTLPHSKAQVRVPLFEFHNAVPGHAGERRGVRPDREVETTAANLLRGVDEQLDAALQLIAQGAR